MYLKLLFFLSIFLSIQNLSFGQKSNFADGYIILTAGDTVFGKIKKLSPLTLSEYVVFQKNGTDTLSRYYPGQVSKYFFEESHYYISDSVPFRKINNENFYRRLFLRQLIEGIPDLYRLDYRITENPSPLYEYQVKFYFIRNNEKGHLIDLTEDNYQSKLSAAFKEIECKPAFNSKTNFNDEGLSNLIIAYNECRRIKATKTYVEQKNIKPELALSIGLGTTQFNLSDNDFNGFKQNAGFGYSMNISVEQQILTWADIRGSISFRHISQRGTNNLTVSEFYTNHGEILHLKSHITTSKLSFPILVKVHPHEKKWTPYAYTGGYFGVGVHSSAYVDKTKFVQEAQGDKLISTRVNPYNADINAFEWGWLIGGGLEFSIKNKPGIFVECQYNKAVNDAPVDSSLRIAEGAFFINLGFNF